MTLSGGKILGWNFDFRGHISTFGAENTPKSGHFKPKNNAQTLPKQLQNNFWEFQKTGFFGPKLPKMTLSESQNLCWNFDFRGHLSTFRAENTPKSGPFKAQNNAQTLLKQLQNNFWKFKKTGFFP